MKTITVGIPAYNEERSIKGLIEDLLRQRVNEARIDKIIVASDGSTDNTVDIAKDIQEKRIVVIAGVTKKGKAYRLNQIIKLSQSDILVLLDADIAIDNTRFLEGLINPIVEDIADLTSGFLDELPPRTFLEKVLDVSMKMKRVLFNEFKKGNNFYNCHGPVRAFNKDFYKTLKFKDSAGEDMYSYFKAKTMNKRFSFVPEAVIRYRLPSTVSEHLKQSVRYSSAKEKYIDIFRPKMREEFYIPYYIYVKAFIKCFPIIFKNPIHFVAYIMVFLLSKIDSKKAKDLDATWQISTSKMIR